MQICFVSNYINHHQIPFCNAMREILGEGFRFLQTESMTQERRRMGWQAQVRPEYVRCFYEEEDFCRKMVLDADVVLFGGCDDESYIEARLQAGKPVIRISERLYKEGQWKAVSPRGLVKKYHDHTRYRNAPVYLLCAGGYTASDFEIVRAYRGKRYCWGYFPETKKYELEQLLERKGWDDSQTEGTKVPYLLWAGRFIDWKHPELAVETARYLREKGYAFQLEMIGGGEMEEQIRELIDRYQLQPYITLAGFKTPGEVRGQMEKADIFLFTSDRKEGWGAVANEAMNSGCALVADHMIGAVPYLIRHGENGYIYEDGRPEQLFAYAEKLLSETQKRHAMGTKAYETITGIWNAENAAYSLMRLIAREKLADVPKAPGASVGTDILAPCAPAPLIKERGAYEKLRGGVL